MSSVSNKEWQQSVKFCETVKNFHDYYCRQPSGVELTNAKAKLKTILDRLRIEIGNLGVFTCKRYEYRGSTYEGVKVYKNPDDPDLEFDVMFVIDGLKLNTIEIPEKPGYAFLTTSLENAVNAPFKQTVVADSSKMDFSKCRGVERAINQPTIRVVSAAQTKTKFFGELSKCPIVKDDKFIKIRVHGPAVQIDVQRGDGRKFSVDLTAHYDLDNSSETKIYVGQVDKDVPDAWFHSDSLRSKRIFDAMDEGNGCRKQVLRILKVTRNRSKELASLNSNILKTCLMYENRDRPGNANWQQNLLGQRLIDVLRRLQMFLSQGRMPHFFITDFNLFAKYNTTNGRIVMKNMHDRIQHLCGSEKEMYKMLAVPLGLSAATNITTEGRVQMDAESGASVAAETEEFSSWMY